MQQILGETLGVLYDFLRGYARGVYIVWVMYWASVLWFYSKGLDKSESAELGVLRPITASKSWFRIFMWSGFPWFFKKRPLPMETFVSTRYSEALKMGITYSALSSVVLGIIFWNSDRSSYGWPLLLLSISAIQLSTLGALMHMSLPLGPTTFKWRVSALASFVFPIIFSLIWCSIVLW